MIRPWPIRVRLTAAFTVMMALVLLGVGTATVAHTRSSLDASISEALSIASNSRRQCASLTAMTEM